MNDLSTLSIGELAAIICEALSKEGLKATLSGGACVEIYSNNKYVTGDLDFVVNYVLSENQKVIDRVMSELGFNKTGRIYINKSVVYSVEFPPGPLGIGEELKIKPVELKFKTGSLSLLSATDSAKDRLTSYFHANDAQCLEQAIMICQMNEVDMDNIRKWAEREKRPEKLKEFERRLLEQKKEK
ncbi:MAG: hypothetical protein A2268_02860 [Candidatus Raymondbacteria bacterium RifOxyA12_full_50_37]|uniref:Uncharacterized protein n=1 Tax=Candidatus Raymondbacteria bacterium RIFOXYD12_FULL_49_13 TaxID=1817890 RepID=A0A1F7F2B8_UNCRA|nr:MAG: hypothetical protein A2268_02860 [Candidatus Raymondbacteria bacterium RifOxyA12_full_50_37]OGJ85923.1 MAG: hypothetical protein A2248_15625 [Candidatus Raymondbacteria bacterium RIFOXYA2_FULL_49_16]OGJ95917.1 MAG: hypothetical protein A2453_01185 [Candidatus Raymondbacteria bacterium RIFOXYC2_FULL_50_21]OGJ96247.1 MAG: hypothetical protein A2487_02830 [Candidatus Raymondbacteria bacterium RifOxyC12_full_50_8]OGK00781.1 MAG: hypothetical protein A2519_14670 [Candidatus Raymondbacteria b